MGKDGEKECGWGKDGSDIGGNKRRRDAEQEI